MSQPLADIGVYGLAVMGENLARNIAGKGFTVVVGNRTPAVVEKFMAGGAAGNPNILGAGSLKEFVAALKPPRKMILLVKAGPAVDELLGQLILLLNPGDIVIDGGNTEYTDTQRRYKYATMRGIRYVGSGVSGGEEGALNGPALMPGGDPEAWRHLQPIFEAIAAKAPQDGKPCCGWIGNDGAGHFVKMVHNGIEYGDMQLICEAYDILRSAGLSDDEMSEVFARWNKGDLSSYLIEIASIILGTKDGDGGPLVEKILDTAGQKGTGKWTVMASVNFNVPTTLITEAVFARCIAARREERLEMEKVYREARPPFVGDKALLVQRLEKGLLAAKMASYAQGYALLRAGSAEYGWKLDLGTIAEIWRAGCIIRSVFLGRIQEAFQRNPELSNLLLDPWFVEKIKGSADDWRRVVTTGIELGVPMPAFSSALAYFEAMRCGMLPANLLQAMRDFFGAHTYERTDAARGEFFHTNWTGKGGSTTARTYTK